MSYKILIVDDSKLARMAVNKALNALYPDWIRIEASNADDAVTSVKEKSPDIALVDFNMPGRDGLDLAAELRWSNPRMRVAVVSANRQKEVVNRTRDIGATFLGKPLTDQGLAEFLKTAVGELEKAQQ